MNLRLVLPPTLAAFIERDAIPTKLELDTGDGRPLTPEKADSTAFAELLAVAKRAYFSGDHPEALDLLQGLRLRCPTKGSPVPRSLCHFLDVGHWKRIRNAPLLFLG